MPIVHSQSAIEVWEIGAEVPTPALLHSTCTAPNASSAASASASTCSSRETSVRTPTASVPRPCSSATASSRGSDSMSARTSFMPAPAKAPGHAQPDARRRPGDHRDLARSCLARAVTLNDISAQREQARRRERVTGVSRQGRPYPGPGATRRRRCTAHPRGHGGWPGIALRRDEATGRGRAERRGRPRLHDRRRPGGRVRSGRADRAQRDRRARGRPPGPLPRGRRRLHARVPGPRADRASPGPSRGAPATPCSPPPPTCEGAFAVVNADDFYGRAAIGSLARALHDDGGPGRFHLVGYRLAATLSPRGTVSRGVCSVDDAGRLVGVARAHRHRP